MNSQESNVSTRVIARVLGPYMVVAMVLYAATTDMQALVSGIESNAALSWGFGAIHVLGGFVVLGLLQEWRSPAAIIIGAFGLIALLEGVLLVGFPSAYFSVADSVSPAASAAVVGLFALYLTYVGWRPARR